MPPMPCAAAVAGRASAASRQSASAALLTGELRARRSVSPRSSSSTSKRPGIFATKTSRACLPGATSANRSYPWRCTSSATSEPTTSATFFPCSTVARLHAADDLAAADDDPHGRHLRLRRRGRRRWRLRWGRRHRRRRWRRARRRCRAALSAAPCDGEREGRDEDRGEVSSHLR